MRLGTRCLVLSLVSALVPAAARAQPSNQADAAFQRARDAIAKGDCKTGLDLMRTSHRLAPGRGKLANIAKCEANLGLVGSAKRHFDELLAQLPAGHPQRAPLEADLARFAHRVPYLRIELAKDAPAATTVKLDGEVVPAQSLGAELPVDPGQHVISASVAGAREKRHDVTLVERQHVGWTVKPEPEPVSAPVAVTARPLVAPPPRQPDETRSVRWKLGVGALSVGGASLVVGAVTGAITLAKTKALSSQCLDRHCYPEDAPAVDARRMFANVSTGTVVAGAALATAGLVLVVTSPRREQHASAWLSPFASAGAFGLQGGF